MRKIVVFILISVLLMSVSAVSFASSARGNDTRYNMVGLQQYKYGAKTHITTTYGYVHDQGSACIAFATNLINKSTWAQTGIFQGLYPYGVYHSSPTYYYEFELFGDYEFKSLGPAPVGQTHEYGVYLSTYSSSSYGDMIMYRDNTILLDYYGFPKEYSDFVAAEAECHGGQNSINYHFSNVEYATQGLHWYPFVNTKFGYYINSLPSYDCPYEIIDKTDTSWTVINR